MSECVEVSFTIIGNVIDDDIYNQIMEAVKRIDDNNINTITHTSGTNTVYVSANWNESEVDEKMEGIRKLPNIKLVVLSKKNKVIRRNNVEPIIKISDEVSWDIEKNPVDEITRAKDAKDYYKAISLSCTVFGHYGKEILLYHSKKTGILVSKLGRLESIICLLYDHNLIDQTIYNKIEGVRKLRNIMQHEDRSFKFSSFQAQEAETIIINSLDCIKLLKIKYENIVREGNK
jgi:hypothetical protein